MKCSVCENILIKKDNIYYCSDCGNSKTIKPNRLRNEKIECRVTKKEKEFILSKAKSCNLTTSEFLRTCAIDSVVIKFDSENSIKELTSEINKIGVNINQIARSINERGGVYDKKEIEILKIRFDEMQSAIYKNMWGVKNGNN